MCGDMITPDGKTEELKLTDSMIPEGSLWQCAWSADSSTACLRLLLPTGMGENWDELFMSCVVDLLEEETAPETPEDGQVMTDGDSAMTEDMSGEEAVLKYYRELW